jgi:hypothetical protein
MVLPASFTRSRGSFGQAGVGWGHVLLDLRGVLSGRGVPTSYLAGRGSLGAFPWFICTAYPTFDGSTVTYTHSFKRKRGHQGECPGMERFMNSFRNAQEHGRPSVLRVVSWACIMRMPPVASVS